MPVTSIQGRCLYEVLGIAKDASQADVRRAYLRLAVQLHPDKNPDDPSASAKFQTLARIHAVLSDPAKRTAYDQTGSIEDSEELAGEKFDELYDFYRGLFPKVTEEDIDRISAEFRGSAGEREELLKYYERFRGDMRKVFEWVMCSDDVLDAHRFMHVLDAEIEAGGAKRYKPYTAWAKRVAARPRPTPRAAAKKRAREAAAANQDLVEAIRCRQRSAMGGLVASLSAKYGVNEEGHEDAPYPEPSEADFEAARRRLEAKQGKAAAAPKESKKEGKKEGRAHAKKKK